MPTYVALIDWTQQGIQNFQESVDRYEAARGQFEQAGVTFKEVYWTLGGHDMVATMEAPDDETIAAVLLRLGSLGNVRTKTLRAFSQDEMRDLIGRAS